MATVLDYLSAPEFSDDALTEVINLAPYVTRPAQLGIFTDTPIPTTFVKMGFREDEITIIPARERGGEDNKNMRGNVAETIFSIPHFPLGGKITPGDIQNIFAWGENRALETMGNVYERELMNIRAKHDLTHSHLDWGALRGLVVDGEGKVLCNLYNQFGVTQKVVQYEFTTDTTNLGAVDREVKAFMRKELRGTPSQGVRILAGAEWFDAYVGHTFERERNKFVIAAPNPDRQDIADTYRNERVIIERIDEDYPFRLPDNTFDVQTAVPVDEAIALPMGTPFFKRYMAPPDTIADANRSPAPESKIFVSTDELPHGKGMDIHTESNVLPICQRPKLIVRLTMN